MHVSRASFGCAVYPNFTQIFVAGGTISDSEATRSCERYIVENDMWKRLPELREPKFNCSLCFFNNGSTLYCFGGLRKKGRQAIDALNSIERLSKGQNQWQKLGVALPMPSFDLGAHQLPSSTDILVFGGYSEGSALSDVWIYKTEGEGRFEGAGTSLSTPDFVQVNGCYIRAKGSDDLVFQCHSGLHRFDLGTRRFATLKMRGAI